MTLLKKEIYQEIKKQIISCQLKPGTFIREADFEKELRASRTPLREAFAKLEEEGLLQVIPKKGVQVKPLSLMSIAHAYEARLLLEPFILNNYWDSINTAAMTKIKIALINLIKKQPLKLSKHYIYSFFELDNKFHRLISESCANEYLSSTLQHVDDEVERVRMQLSYNSRYLESAQEHIVVIKAIEGNDKKAAVAALVTHIKNSQGVALNSISHRNIDYVTFQ